MERAEAPKRVTRDDVARKAGVSSATVSYVVNNGPRPVSASTRKKVLQAIRDLRYKPNAVARHLRLQRTPTLGLIIPDTFNPYFAEVARGIEAAAFENGFIVVLCHSHYELEKETRYIDVLTAERAAGVIWIPATEDNSPATRVLENQLPLVILDRTIGIRDVLSVVADNFRGGYLATSHLIGLGHRRIGFINRPVALEHSNDRLRGFKAALCDAGLNADDSLIISGGYRFDDGQLAAKRLLTLPERPTAIFAYNDLMAIGAYRAARELNLRIPQDVSVVGFDDIPGAEFTFPPLTSVCQPKLEMGRRCAEMLIDLINGKEQTGERQVKMDVQLKVRESTGPVS